MNKLILLAALSALCHAASFPTHLRPGRHLKRGNGKSTPAPVTEAPTPAPVTEAPTPVPPPIYDSLIDSDLIYSDDLSRCDQNSYFRMSSVSSTSLAQFREDASRLQSMISRTMRKLESKRLADIGFTRYSSTAMHIDDVVHTEFEVTVRIVDKTLAEDILAHFQSIDPIFLTKYELVRLRFGEDSHSFLKAALSAAHVHIMEEEAMVSPRFHIAITFDAYWQTSVAMCSTDQVNLIWANLMEVFNDPSSKECIMDNTKEACESIANLVRNVQTQPDCLLAGQGYLNQKSYRLLLGIYSSPSRKLCFSASVTTDSVEISAAPWPPVLHLGVSLAAFVAFMNA